jgi:hypothetical protein
MPVDESFKEIGSALWRNKPLFITVVIGLLVVIYIVYKNSQANATAASPTSGSITPTGSTGTYVEESYYVGPTTTNNTITTTDPSTGLGVGTTPIQPGPTPNPSPLPITPGPAKTFAVALIAKGSKFWHGQDNKTSDAWIYFVSGKKSNYGGSLGNQVQYFPKGTKVYKGTTAGSILFQVPGGSVQSWTSA